MKSIKVNVELGLPDKKKVQTLWNQQMGEGVELSLDSASFKKQFNELRKQMDKLALEVGFDKQQKDIISNYLKNVGIEGGKTLAKAIKDGWNNGDIESIFKDTFNTKLAKESKEASSKLTKDMLEVYKSLVSGFSGQKISLDGLDFDQSEIDNLKTQFQRTLTIDPKGTGVDELISKVRELSQTTGFSEKTGILFDSKDIKANISQLAEVIAQYRTIKNEGLTTGVGEEREKELYSDIQKHYVDLIASLQNLEQARNNVFDEDGNVKIQEETQAIEKQTKAIREQRDILGEKTDIKTSEVSFIDDDGAEKLVKTIESYKDEIGQVVTITRNVNSETGEVTSTIKQVTDEIEKTRQAEKKFEESIYKSNDALEVKKQKLKETLDGLYSRGNVSESSLNATGLEDKINNINLGTSSAEMEKINRLLREQLANEKEIIATKKSENKERERAIRDQLNLKESEEKERAKAIKDQLNLTQKIDETKKKYNTTLDVIEKMNKKLLESSHGKGLKETLNSIREEVNNLNPDSINALNSKTKEFDNTLRTTKADISAMNKEWTLSTRNAVSFGSAIGDVAKAVGIFDITHRAINATMNSFSNGVEDVVAMDTALADLNKVVDLSKSQLLSMRDASVEMGKALGRSSIDVAQGMAEFGRQYKNIEDIKRMTEASIIGANVMDGMSSGDVAKGLTTILNSMKMESTEVMTIIDSMNEIQNRYRISATDMTNALAKVGSVANTSGVDLQELEGYITAVTVATGKAGDEVGTAIRAIMARTYKDYSVTALEKVGVAVRDAKGEFRDFPDIMADLDKTWQNLTKTQKIELAQTVAGVQRYNEFMSLMNNFGMATSSTATAMDSLGSATKENEIYLNSIEGKMQTLKTTAQEFWYNLVNSDFVKLVVDGGTSVLKVLNELSETFGSLPTTVGLMSTAFLMFTNNPLKNFSRAIVEGNFNTTKFKIALDNAKVSMSTTSGVANKAIVGVKSLASSFDVAKVEAIATSVAISALNTAMSMGLSFGITAILSGLGKITDAMITTKAETRELNEEFVSFAQSNNGADGTRLVNQYKDLQGQLATLKEGTNEYKLVEDELIKTQERLAELYPEVNNLIDENTGKKLINLEATEKLAGKELEKAIAKAYTNLEDNDVEKLSDVEALVRKYEDYARIVSELNDLKDKGGKSKKITGLSEEVSMSGELKIATKDLDVYLERMEDAEGVLKAVASATDVLGIKNEEWASANELICESLGIVNDEINNVDSSTIDNARDAMEGLGDETENTKTELENLIDAFSSFEQPIELLEKAIEEYKEYGILSTDTFHDIIKSGNADLIALLADNETFLSNAEGM